MGVPIVLNSVNTLPLPITSHTLTETTASSHHFALSSRTISERKDHDRVALKNGHGHRDIQTDDWYFILLLLLWALLTCRMEAESSGCSADFDFHSHVCIIIIPW